jgi:hypothetical protein
MKRLLIKIVFSIFSFVLVTYHVQAQNMVVDALELSKHATNGPTKAILDTGSTVYTILDKYIEPQKQNTLEELGVSLTQANNPFIVFDGSVRDADQSMLAGGAAGFQSLLNNVGNLNITSLADALAIVVVDRLKAELNEQFFDGFKTELNNSPELTALFPQTKNLLDLISTGIYDYQTYIPALRQAFNADLKNLYTNTPALLNTPKFKEFINAHNDLGTVISAALITSKLVAEDKSAADVIHTLANQIGGNNPKVQGLFKTVGIIAKSLENTDVTKAEAWVNIDSVKMLIQNPKAMRIYLGLLYQTAGTINLDNGVTLRTELAKFVPDSVQTKIADMLIIISTAVQDVETIVNNYKTDTTQKKYKKYYDYYESYTVLLKTLAENVNTLFNLNIGQNITQYYTISQSLGTMYLNVNEANYTAAIVNLVSTIKLIDKDGKVLNNDHVQQLLRYGTFMAMAVEAKTSQELADVINNVILPSGNSAAKAKTSKLLTLNSYIGGFYSWKTDQTDSVKKSAGLSLPIGPNFSFGLRNYTLSKKHNCKLHNFVGGISVFVPLVDIGAFASYRISDTSTATLPAVKLENIFAPGIMLGLNRIFNTPLTFMGGLQKTPPLQTISASGATYTNNSWRWQISLTWDIPLFNLYYKPKN